MRIPTSIQNGIRSARPSGAGWAVFAAVAASLPVAGVFTLTNVFFVRDLGLFFWPRYLWLRQTLLQGELPLWDPFIGGGQATIAEALVQPFLLPTLAIRLLGSEVVGFNLWVALPFPLAALGAYALFRRRFSGRSAALGAIVFSLSGPVASTANFPNLSWSTALIPWVLWSAGRCSTGAPRSFATLALIFGGQILAGEPVTMAATALLALGYVIFVPDHERGGCARASGALLVTAALAAGALLAAVQILPLLEATANSSRVAGEIDNFWSLHPLTLVETVAPHYFGDYYTAFFASLPWMQPLNSGRDPFFYSQYLGVGALGLAALGLTSCICRRWGCFWMLAGAIALVAALGSYTPLYPALQDTIPAVGVFRYPAKYLLITVIAVAALAAAGWDALERRAFRLPLPGGDRLPIWIAAGIAAGCAAAAYVVMALTIAAPETAARAFYELARAVGVRDAVHGAAFLLDVTPMLGVRLVLLGLATAGLLAVAWSARPQGRLARVVMYALIVVDLAATHATLNPTISPALLGPPSWAQLAQTPDGARTYYGGRIDGWVDPRDIDAPKRWYMPGELSPVAARVVVSAETGLAPSAWGIREIISYDLPVLWPREYEQMLERFKRASGQERVRFLSRAGARYCVLPEAPDSPSAPLHHVRYFDGMALYQCKQPPVPRASIVTRASIEPTLELQLERLFQAAFDPANEVMLQTAATVAAGAVRAPQPPFAQVVEDLRGAVSVQASTGEGGGYLVLLDSYSPSWRVEVDGRPAELLRANALFRAVYLAPGEHLVRFRYRPAALWAGLGVSMLTALGIVAAIAFPRRQTSAASVAQREPAIWVS